MSTTTATHFTSTFFFLSSIILFCFPGTIRTDTPCPYPCYPPPIAGGSVTPATPSVSYSPPQSVLPYPPPPPPSGYYPYNPTTPPYGGGNSNNDNGGGGRGGGDYGTPPPPDPILPYFPFYYKKPPHQTEDSSAGASVTMEKLTVTGIVATLVLFIFVL